MHIHYFICFYLVSVSVLRSFKVIHTHIIRRLTHIHTHKYRTHNINSLTPQIPIIPNRNGLQRFHRKNGESIL